MDLPPMRLLYRGPVNWQKVYSGSKGFWASRKFDVIETNYKDKSNEFEGKWIMEQEIDAYYKFVYTIEFKLWDASAAGKAPDGGTIYNGKLRIILSEKIEEQFNSPSVAGKKVIFEKGENESTLHKIFKLVTRRDREETLAGKGIGQAQQYFDFLKRECNMEMKVIE